MPLAGRASRGRARRLAEEAAVRAPAGKCSAVFSFPAAALELEESVDPLRRIIPDLQFPVLEFAVFGEAPFEATQLVARLSRVRFFQQAFTVPARPQQRTAELVRNVRTLHILEDLGECRHKSAICVDVSPLDDNTGVL